MNPINKHRRFKIGMAVAMVGLATVAGALRAEAQGATISVCKFYDFPSLDGVKDPGDKGIAGWRFVLTPLTPGGGTNQVGVTQADGGTNFVVAPGSYYVTEILPDVRWVPTGISHGSNDVVTDVSATTVLVTVTNGHGASLCFGNVCIGTNGATLPQPPSYWSGPGGQGEFATNDVLQARLDPFNPDTYLPGNPPELVNSVAGGIFDRTNYVELRDWIRGANSFNLAYCLSVEVGVAQLNNDTGRLTFEELVYAPGLPPDLGITYYDANGLFALLGDVVAGAQNLIGDLLADTGGLGVVSPRDSNAGVFQAFKRALGDVNRNRNFVQATPCPFSYGRVTPTAICPPRVPPPAPVEAPVVVKPPAATSTAVAASPHRAEMAQPR
jgi:hypothetical protein